MTPIERFALRYYESTQEPVITEQQKLQDVSVYLMRSKQYSDHDIKILNFQEELEAEKREWELSRMNAIKEEEKRHSEALKEERESVITCHREDAYTQVNNNQKRNTRVRDRRNMTQDNAKVRELGTVLNGRSKRGQSSPSPRKNVSSKFVKQPLTNGVPQNAPKSARKSTRGMNSPQRKSSSSKSNDTHYSLRNASESSPPKRARKASLSQDTPTPVSPTRDMRTRQGSNSGSSSPTKRTRGSSYQSPTQTPTKSTDRVLRRSSRGAFC